VAKVCEVEYFISPNVVLIDIQLCR